MSVIFVDENVHNGHSYYPRMHQFKQTPVI